ncbi:fibronectin type III domain-containing protein [Dactylosporangium aurantiacum]|uniref:Fibronectin type III domain-containing protein n=1 Tax=Dactylosporangium aurantiacum TaxID=35754 RepID=A0A9Q9MI19_9ACTN|nr:fibronectin type III domain-containing protein [Dactylosporangium aurantiacum]MDG6110239.1 fibronectin type III domain-containing protein [Dactylosporangium aurantiacum]UWZ55420.1 fibronectin type III domain-containing protein [Dactylosporangium aurantiacum]
MRKRYAFAGVCVMTLTMLVPVAPAHAASGTARTTESAPAAFTTVGADTYVVPAGVTQIDVVVVGGRGGNVSPATGGLGAKVSGRLAVTPGETLDVFVGGDGVQAYYTGTQTGSHTLPGTAGGAGGGGAGGSGRMIVAGIYSYFSAGAGGGGASRISRSGTDLVVAGGGGGASGSSGPNGAITNGSNGGAAGTGSGDGQDGAAASNGSTTAVAGAGGVSGGNGGAAPGGATAGGSGSAGTGGAGGDAAHTNTQATPNYSASSTGGGGGGGGVVGGSGGNGGATSINGSGTAAATGGGGGAGSSLVPAGGTIEAPSVSRRVEITPVVTPPSGQAGQLQVTQPASSSRDVTVSWSAAGVTWGDGANRRFTVVVSPATVSNSTCTGLTDASTGCTFTADADGTYTVSVTPETDAGSATLASAQVPVALVVPPPAPVAPSGQVGQLQAAQGASRDVTVSWSAAGVTWGGGANRRFTVAVSPTTVSASTCTGLADTATGCTFTATADGTYTVTVTPKTDAGGATPATTSVTVTSASAPAAPDAPAAVTVTAGTSSIAVQWSGAVAHGSPVTGYVATAEPGPASCTTTTATSCVLGARAGVTYTVRVMAKSAAGDSPPSAASAPVTPVAPVNPPVPPAPQATLDLDTGTRSGLLLPGSSVTVRGDGYAAHSTVTLTMYSTPVSLTSVVTDATGSFVTQVTLPAGLAAGQHAIVAQGVDTLGVPRIMQVSATIRATAALRGSLPVTGVPVTVLWLLGAALLMGGAALRWTARRA